MEFLSTKNEDGVIGEYSRPLKSFMCPLGEKCPGDVRPRWPTSDIRTTKTLGD